MIEDLVISVCKEQLTPERIEDIAEKVTKATEQMTDLSNLNRLKKQLQEIERKQRNLMDAIMECDIDIARKALYAEIPKLEEAKKSVEKEISLEEKETVKLTKQQVKFFLTALKDGDVQDIRYRRTLIAVFINKIYLYDDKMLIFCNIGAKPTTVSLSLLQAVEEKTAECSDLEQVGQPSWRYTNIIFIEDGMIIIIYFV